MKVKSRKQPVVPKIGVWYHRKEKSLYGGDHRVFLEEIIAFSTFAHK